MFTRDFAERVEQCETRHLPTSSTWFTLRTPNQLVKTKKDIFKKRRKHESRLELISLGHQVNTLFCLIAAKRKRKGRRKRGERERTRGRSGGRRLQTLGELWLQAFVSNLKTKSSGNIKTSFKNNINIFCGLYMAQYYPRHVHDTKTV